ncbi:GIY-YIG nuclease family protein [Clostridium gasigenes]|uniref:GIY-YIG nuclease family protein n=1 Tax=Clostridium gasigenes TaxID=94869 RepID=UPI001C0DD5FB|nr:GIY-YIG nuclease family protein [Clostridium gasigenes]MBU3135048.1 GIY-YIG nuclease family protein [Clostridium gasigenes]
MENKYRGRYKAYQKAYQAEYYKENYEKINEATRRNIMLKKGCYVYKIINSNGEVLYIGSTCLIGRLGAHLRGNTNLKIDLSECYIEYCSLSDEFTKEERLMCEQYLIELYKPIFNIKKAYSGEINERVIDVFLANEYWEEYARKGEVLND